jgi:hypothetical protein
VVGPEPTLTLFIPTTNCDASDSGPIEMGHEQMAAQLSEALCRKIVFQDEVAAGTCWIGLLSP